MRQSDHTAILFFSRTPQEEARCKRIVSRRKTLTVSRALQEHSLREAQLIGLPVFQYTGKEQRGDSFGERLANAIEEVFAKGFERLLVIGNDTPDLDAAVLQNARESLDDDKLVLGPSTDGGVYLIGLTTDAYQRDAFLQLAWETEFLQDTFRSYASQYGLAISRLSPLADIDNSFDFWQFFHALPAECEWRAIFSTLVISPGKIARRDYAIAFQLVGFLGCRALRAPPSLA